MSDQPRGDGVLRIAVPPVRFDMPGPFAFHHGYRLVQLLAPVVQPDSVLGGVSGGQDTLRHHLAIGASPRLGAEVVVDPIAERQETQAAGG